MPIKNKHTERTGEKLFEDHFVDDIDDVVTDKKSIYLTNDKS